MRYIVAIFVPWLVFFTIKRPVQGIFCLILQISIVGWLPAVLWSWIAISNYQTDKKIEKLTKSLTAAPVAQPSQRL